MSALAVVNAAAGSLALIWVYSAGFIVLGQRLLPGADLRRPRFVFHELRPFYLPCVVALFLTWLDPPPLWARVGALALMVAYWFYLKDIDEDDRWKRRRRKVVDKVSQVGGRLTVVPATSGGPS